MTLSTQAHRRETPARTTEHAWQTESRHNTSLGVLTYVRCVECGARRVDLQPTSTVVPEGISHVLPH